MLRPLQVPLVAVLLALLMPAAEASSAPVLYANQYEPQRVAIKGHGHYHSLSAHALLWSDWGQPTATARGTFTYQFCLTESCSVSPFYDEPAVVTLSAIRNCRGRLYYSVLALTVEGPMPDGSFKGYRASAAACRRPHGH